ncbi:hypothetical protein EI94DRAFT_1699562 [Lactarius quietus]|nr:hypothetical protein EI94DRAFT_1699562 [Lactarius quietus]
MRDPSDKPVVLTEAKLPSVLKTVSNLLLAHGSSSNWVGINAQCHNFFGNIENSSEPFRAVLGAVLSIQKWVPIQASVFDPDTELDIISEEENKCIPKGRRPRQFESTPPGRFEDSHSIRGPNLFSPVHQVSGRLRNPDYNLLANLSKYRDSLFAIKVCYGTFEGDMTGALILELCDGVLKSWDELNSSERTQVYRLERNLHKVGIVHGDLEPRNVARVSGGGFRLIDYSSSGKHSTCEETSFLKPLQTRDPNARRAPVRARPASIDTNAKATKTQLELLPTASALWGWSPL